MGGLKETIAEKLPEGSIVKDIYTDPADDTKLIIEYRLAGKLYYVSPERIDVSTLLDYRKAIPLLDGLTYNDVYEITSKRHNLNLVKGIDYEDNQTTITETGWIFLPIYKYSLRFIPNSIRANIVDSKTVIIGDEATRDLRDVDILFDDGIILRDELRALSLKFFDLKNITCFSNGDITRAFKTAIADTIDDTSVELKQEIMSSILLKGYSDALSDVALLVGEDQIPYIIRYESAKGDVP